jgi:hypothetical protein
MKRIPSRKCAWATVLLLAFAPSPSKAQEPQEDSRAVHTREFLGLGRMPDPKMAAEGAKNLCPHLRLLSWHRCSRRKRSRPVAIGGGTR